MGKHRFWLLLAGGLLLAFWLIFSEVLDRPAGKDEGFRYLIGVSQPHLMDPWRLAINKEIAQEAAKHPDLKVIYCDAAEDNAKQRQDLENLVKYRIDLLIVSPNDPAFLAPTIRRLYRGGLPIIMLEYGIAAGDYTMLICANNTDLGRRAGEYVAALLGGPGGKVLEIQGDPYSQVTIERKRGFRDVIRRHPEIKLDYVVVGYWSMDRTEVRVEEIFRQDPGVDVVFAQNDAMALGAWRIGKKYGIKAEYIGVNGIPGKHGGLEAVRGGILSATFVYPPGGKEAVRYAMKILGGDEVPKRLEIPVRIASKENLPAKP